MKKIAIIGSGISGLTCAYLLGKKHQVTLFEANSRLGGHTATKDVFVDGKEYAIDTGFIVFNDWTYPNFNQLLDKAGVDIQKTEMSFSVHHMETGIEYNGNNLSTLFAQRSNLVNPRFYQFLWEIIRFNRLTKKLLNNNAEVEVQALGEFLQRYQFSEFFASHYILPMVAAIWSASIKDSESFPFRLFLKFFNNHGLLNVFNRPQWYVIKNGSRSYIPALTENVRDVRLKCPVQHIKRNEHGVEISVVPGQYEQFDEVILACHSDQALKMLQDATEAEQQVLGNLKYRNNEVVLHTDTRLLPKETRAWASWNFWQEDNDDKPPAVTYNMNILQGIESDHTFCVTLNRTAAIDPLKILGFYHYSHPVYDRDAVEAQSRRDQICGKQNTHFCGAYWYNGFHEDGVNSALDVSRRFGASL